MKKRKFFNIWSAIVVLAAVGVFIGLVGFGINQQGELLQKAEICFLEKKYGEAVNLLENPGPLVKCSRKIIDRLRFKEDLLLALCKLELLDDEEASVLALVRAKRGGALIKTRVLIHEADEFFQGGAYGKALSYYLEAMGIGELDEAAKKRLEVLRYLFESAEEGKDGKKKKKLLLRDPDLLDDIYGREKPQNRENESRR